MGCKVVDMPGGGRAILCSRGAKAKKCGWCWRSGTKLCDFELVNGGTCDISMCDVHAKPVGKNRDLCPKHSKVPVE